MDSISKKLYQLHQEFLGEVLIPIANIITYQDGLFKSMRSDYDKMKEEIVNVNELKEREKLLDKNEYRMKSKIPKILVNSLIVYAHSKTEDLLNKAIIILLSHEKKPFTPINAKLNDIKIDINKSVEEIFNEVIESEVKWIREGVFGRLQYLVKKTCIGDKILVDYNGYSVDKNKLKELTAIRNIIVHNNSTIDVKFTVSNTNPKYKTGEKLKIDATQAFEYVRCMENVLYCLFLTYAVNYETPLRIKNTSS